MRIDENRGRFIMFVKGNTGFGKNPLKDLQIKKVALDKRHFVEINLKTYSLYECMLYRNKVCTLPNISNEKRHTQTLTYFLLVPWSFYICLNICLDQQWFLFTLHIYYFSHFYLCYVAIFIIMLFNCFPMFYIYICSDYVLNM